MSAISKAGKRMDSLVASKMKINSRLSHDDIRFLAHVAGVLYRLDSVATHISKIQDEDIFK